MWEGGTRATAFIHSPLLKKSGYTYTGLVHGVDWLSTIIHGALPAHGIDSTATTGKPLDGKRTYNFDARRSTHLTASDCAGPNMVYAVAIEKVCDQNVWNASRVQHVGRFQPQQHLATD